MCEFCENIGIGMPNYTFCDEESETYKNSSGAFIEIRKILDKYALVFSNSADEYRYGALNIAYCPICGRKLSEVSENENKCNLSTCRYNRNGICQNKEKRKECVEVSKSVLCLEDKENEFYETEKEK